MAKAKKELTTIEDIMKALKKKAKYIINMEKLDGITIECDLAESKKAVDKVDELKDICKDIKNTSCAIEVNEDLPFRFLIQFPDMVPEYQEEDIEKMYTDTFEWLIGNYLGNSKVDNKAIEQFIKNKDMFVKHAIMIYYRSNTNQYKDKPEDYLNNFEYRTNIDKIYLNYIASR